MNKEYLIGFLVFLTLLEYSASIFYAIFSNAKDRVEFSTHHMVRAIWLLGLILLNK